MKEMDELSSGIERLKRNSDSQKRLIDQLQKDRVFLVERTRFLGQKLSEAYVIYEEAGKRILDFVDKETAPIKNQIAELKAETGKITGIEQELKTHTSYLSRIRSGDDVLKARLAEAEKTIKKLNELAAVSKSHIDRLRERETKEDRALESRLDGMKSHFESQLKTAQDRLSLKVTEASEEVLQDASDSINALAASHEETRKNLSQTALFVKQLKVSTVTLRKKLENAAFSRAEIEKRVSVQQASIKELDSAVSKLERKLRDIGLEDEKLEKRLRESRKAVEESVNLKVGQLREHVDSHEKNIDAKLSSRIAGLSEALDSKIEKLASEREGLSSRIEKQNSTFGKLARDQHADFEAAKSDIKKSVTVMRGDMEDSLNSKSVQLKARLDSQQKKQDEMMATRLKVISQEFGNRISKLNERLASEREDVQVIESLLSEKIKGSEKSSQAIKSELRKRLSVHQASIRGMESAMARMAKRLEGISLEDEKLEKRLAELRKKAEESTDSKIGRLKSHAELAEKRQLERIDSKLKAIVELERKIAEVRKAAEESVSSKVGQLREHVDSHEKNIDAKLSSRIAGLSEALDSKIEKLASEQEGLSSRIEGQTADFRTVLKGQHDHVQSVRDDLQNRIADARKGAEAVVVSRTEQLKSHFDAVARKQAEVLENRLKVINEIEGRISGIIKATEHTIDSRVAHLKAHVDSAQKTQAGLFEARLKAVSGDFAASMAKLDETLADERRDIKEIVSLVNEKISGSEKSLDSKLAESYAQIEKRISQVSSHVASEKKAMEGTKNSILKGMREEQHGLSSRLKAVSEKSLQRVAGLSAEVSAEKKGLAEQRAKFSERMNAAGQAIARLNELTKSVDNRLKKYEDMADMKIQKNHEAVANVAKRVDSLAAALEKSGSASKGLDVRLERLDSQAYSERKALMDKIKSLESGLKAASLEISGLSKQLSAVSSSRVSANKRMFGAEARLKQLRSADSAMASVVEKQHAELQNAAKERGRNAEYMSTIEKRLSAQQEYVKGLESTLARVAKMAENANLQDKGLEKRISQAKEEIMRRLLEERMPLEKKTAKVSSGHEEIAKRLGAMENAMRMFMEKASQREKHAVLNVEELKAQIAETAKALEKIRARDAELKDYVNSLVKAGQSSAGTEISRVYSEMAGLKKELAEWQQEQARLYDLLKEED